MIQHDDFLRLKIPAEAKELLAEVARAQCISSSALVRRALDEYLSRHLAEAAGGNLFPTGGYRRRRGL